MKCKSSSVMSESQQIQQWRKLMLMDLESLKTNDTFCKHYVNSTASKVTAWVGCVVCCSPCFLWSAFWRCVTCPFVCPFKGIEVACGGNECTRCPDTCMFECTNEIDRVIEPMALLSKGAFAQSGSLLQACKDNTEVRNAVLDVLQQGLDNIKPIKGLTEQPVVPRGLYRTVDLMLRILGLLNMQDGTNGIKPVDFHAVLQTKMDILAH